MYNTFLFKMFVEWKLKNRDNIKLSMTRHGDWLEGWSSILNNYSKLT